MIISREILFKDEIFAASIHGSPEESVTDLSNNLRSEGKSAPRKGSTVLVREREDGDDWFDDWFEVIV